MAMGGPILDRIVREKKELAKKVKSLEESTKLYKEVAEAAEIYRKEIESPYISQQPVLQARDRLFESLIPLQKKGLLSNELSS